MKAITETNLMSAFGGESQAHMRYLLFSDVAAEEDLPNVARLFSAISYAEKVHAGLHFRNLSHLKGAYTVNSGAGFGPGDTLKNLEISIEGESFEVEEMYPVYIETSKFQGERSATIGMEWALKVEKIHLAMYMRAKKAVESGRDLDLGEVFVCEGCGYTVEGDVPDICPICGSRSDRFQAFP